MKRLKTGLLVTISTVLAGLSQSPLQAQSCQALSVVKGEGTVVEKSVSIPSIAILRNNWDTDFNAAAVPADLYVATVEVEDGGEYSIEMYLKYPDDSADEVFNDSVRLSAGETLEIEGSRRLDDRPYQINLSVGGISAAGQNYRASVVGC